MASRKEQKEALRQERLRREQEAAAARRRKQLLGYGVGGVLAAVAIGVVAALLVAGGGDDGTNDPNTDIYPSGIAIPERGELSVNLPAAAKAAGCTLESKPAPGREHLDDPDATERYNLNPPAAGNHYQVPAEDGIYNQPARKEHLVHTQEHGRVIIWFKPSIPANDRGQLKTLFDEDPIQLVLTPVDFDMPYQVAATAWSRDPEPLGTGRLMGCPRFNEDVIEALRAFIGEYRGNGPEAVP